MGRLQTQFFTSYKSKIIFNESCSHEAKMDFNNKYFISYAEQKKIFDKKII